MTDITPHDLERVILETYDRIQALPAPEQPRAVNELPPDTRRLYMQYRALEKSGKSPRRIKAKEIRDADRLAAKQEREAAKAAKDAARVAKGEAKAARDAKIGDFERRLAARREEMYSDLANEIEGYRVETYAAKMKLQRECAAKIKAARARTLDRWNEIQAASWAKFNEAYPKP